MIKQMILCMKINKLDYLNFIKICLKRLINKAKNIYEFFNQVKSNIKYFKQKLALS